VIPRRPRPSKHYENDVTGVETTVRADLQGLRHPTFGT
jgi:hypothetical protein